MTTDKVITAVPLRQPIFYEGSVPTGGFEAADAWGGGAGDTAIFHEGLQSQRQLPGAFTSHLYGPTQGTELLNLEGYDEMTIQSRWDLGFYNGDVELVIRDVDLVLGGGTFTTGVPLLAPNAFFKARLTRKQLVDGSPGVNLGRIFSVALRSLGGPGSSNIWLDDWRGSFSRGGNLITVPGRVS